MKKEIKQLKKIKEQENISYDELARKIGVNLRNVYRWLKEDIEPGQMAMKLIQGFLEKRNVSK